MTKDPLPHQSAQGSYIAQAGPNSTATITIVHNRNTSLSVSERRLRNQMLDKVYNFWIGSVLEDSLHKALLIELGMEYRPDAVTYPWEMVFQRSEAGSDVLPPGTKILEVYEGQSGELLILGAPGSGKTTMLLDLARSLISNAREDEFLAIPIVFVLSTWAQNQQPIADWLVQELDIRYKLSQKTGREWVENNKMTLLLDGLDEVPATCRDKCIEALNTFRSEHDLVSMVVCSRIDDYTTLRTKLELQGAVMLQPLTQHQVSEYLAQGDDSLRQLGKLIEQDLELRKLAATPLLLNIMAMVYRKHSSDEAHNTGDQGVQDRNLMTAYVDHMFLRRGNKTIYKPHDTVRWLTWLAREMDRHSQGIFHIEQLQPDWLPTYHQQRFYYRVLNWVVKLQGAVWLGLMFGFSLGWLWGLGAAIVAIVVMKRKRDDKTDNVVVIEAINWSWRAARKNFWPVIRANWLWLTMFSVIVLAVSGQLNIYRILLFQAWAAILNLPEIILLGFEGTELPTKTEPNQGIRRSLRSANLGAAARGLIKGTFATLVFFYMGWNSLGDVIILILLWLLFPALDGWFWYGGTACIQHVTLRLLLWRSNMAPLNYADFLDYASERIFLRKVGGGYIFMHDLSREYFVSLGTFTQDAVDDRMRIPRRYLAAAAVILCTVLYVSGAFRTGYEYFETLNARYWLDRHTRNGIQDIELYDYASALQEFGQAITYGPHQADVYYYRGLAHFLNRDFALARDDMDAALSKDTNFAAAYWMRAWSNAIVGNSPEAANDIRSAAGAVNPSLPPAKSIYIAEQLERALSEQALQTAESGDMENAALLFTSGLGMEISRLASMSGVAGASHFMPSEIEVGTANIVAARGSYTFSIDDIKQYLTSGLLTYFQVEDREMDYEEMVEVFSPMLVKQVGAQTTSEAWHTICQSAVSDGRAAQVVHTACEKAVALSDYQHLPDYRDSRGVARALTNDFGGAIEDFIFYVDSYRDSTFYDSSIKTHEEWIALLRNGVNPLDSDVFQVFAW